MLRNNMKKYLLALSVAVATPAAAEPLAYPGTAWVNVTGPHAGAGEDGNWTVTSKVQQGVDWTEVNGWRLNTAVSVSTMVDTKGFDWNNRVAPAISASVRKTTESSVFEFGVQVVNETHFGRVYKMNDRSSTNVQVFANYWVGWGR